MAEDFREVRRRGDEAHHEGCVVGAGDADLLGVLLDAVPIVGRALDRVEKRAVGGAEGGVKEVEPGGADDPRGYRLAGLELGALADPKGPDKPVIGNGP